MSVHTFCYWLVYRLKHPLNIMLAVALTVGHSWGSSTWLGPWLGLWFEQAGFLTTRSLILLQWTFLVGYFALVGVCAGISLALYMRIYEASKRTEGMTTIGSHPSVRQLE